MEGSKCSNEESRLAGPWWRLSTSGGDAFIGGEEEERQNGERFEEGGR
jgi:hypothetical protein